MSQDPLKEAIATQMKHARRKLPHKTSKNWRKKLLIIGLGLVLVSVILSSLGHYF